MVVAHPDHPYYMELIKHYQVRTIDEALNTYETYELVIDLSPLRTQKKFLFVKELAKTTKAPIISDLTLCWGEWVFKYAPQVIGAVSTLFSWNISSKLMDVLSSKPALSRTALKYFNASGSDVEALFPIMASE